MDHMLNQLLLVLSLVSWNELVESFNSSADHDVSCIVLHKAVLLLWSDQVLLIIDVSDRNGNVAVINCLSNVCI